MSLLLTNSLNQMGEHPLAEGTTKPTRLFGIISLLGAVTLFGSNPLIGILGTLVALAIAKMMWSPSEPQTLVFILGFQWVQAFASVFVALLDGQPIEVTLGGPQFETATILSLLALLILAFGIKFGGRKSIPASAKSLRSGLESLRKNRLVIAWVLLSLLNVGLSILGAKFPAIRQALIAFEVWKWASVLLIFFRWLALGEGRLMAVSVLLVELIIGTMGYFSSFKQVFFILLVAATGVTAVTGKRSLILAGVGVVMIFFLGFWQVIKNPYRSFLSRGERAQVVDVSLQERVEWLTTVVGMIDRDMVSTGWKAGLARISYVEYFGHSINVVPSIIPHTNGKLWKEAIMHPLMPRFLFPNKPSIDDSERTNAYTGVSVAGAEEGTSVSIGYIGESYIDFGMFGMFIPIFLWGLLIGKCSSLLRRKAPHPLFGSVLSSCLLISSVMLMESSNLKLVGGFLSAFLVSLVILHFFGRRLWAMIGGELTEPPTEDSETTEQVS